MDQELDYQELSGTVETVIFKNEENGYTVLRLRSDSGETVTVVGCFPFAAPGESMILSGEWMTHSVHGRQFKAEFAQRFLPHSAPAIYQFLAGGAVKGVGPATASLIVDRFGDQTLDVILNNWQALAEIRGISSAKAQQISKSFRQQAGLRMLMEFVCSFGLRPVLALRAYKYYGDKALETLRENPYILCSTLIGASFREADEMAMGLGMGENSKNRIAAAILFELIHNTGNGHCFIPREKLAAVTAELIGVESGEADACIAEMIEDLRLRCEEIAGVRACYLPELYEAETNAAENFARMSRRQFRDKLNTEKLLQKLEIQQHIRYAPMQRQTLELALKNQLLVITGGPGTGKTTSIRAILAMFDALGFKTLLCAPTGRAAKRMTELTGREAATVHRLLGAKFDEEGDRVVFTKDESERLDCDAVILDECSMVDIQLMDALLRALPPDARLVLVGDADAPLRRAGERVLRAPEKPGGGRRAPHGDLPPERGQPHHPQRPHDQPRRAPRSLGKRRGLFPSQAPAGRQHGRYHHGALFRAPAAENAHPAGGDPGPLPDTQGGDGHGQSQQKTPGGAEPAGPGEKGKALRGGRLPRGGPGDAGQKQL